MDCCNSTIDGKRNVSIHKSSQGIRNKYGISHYRPTLVSSSINILLLGLTVILSTSYSIFVYLKGNGLIAIQIWFETLTGWQT